MRIDGEVFESFYRFFGRPLCLQVGLQDIDVMIRLLETVALDGFDALEQLAAIEDRLGGSERIGGLGWRLTLYESEGVKADAEPFKVDSRAVEVDFIASKVDLRNLEPSSGSAVPDDFVTDMGNDWLLWCGGFLAWLGRWRKILHDESD